MPDPTWHGHLTSSHLLQYEVWNRLFVRGTSDERERHARHLLGRIQLIDLAPDVLARALKPFPIDVRTLDGLHLATIEYLRDEGENVELATFDARMIAAASAMEIPLYAR